MDDVPPPLILEILSRLNNSADLARCRLVCKTLNSVSSEVRSINLHCSFDRYTKSRSPATSSAITPFKTVFKNLVSTLRHVDSISLGVEKPLGGLSYDDVEDESDDLYLMGVDFVAEWLPKVGGRLRSISISDFWIQSCWRRSEILSLISSFCHSLLELELKNAWLSVDGLHQMPMLTSLTLEFVRLDDEDLRKVIVCFPSLQNLNLIGVGGLKDPKIHLLHLRACQWTVSNAPLSLTVLAPKLITLRLKCVNPGSLVVYAPLLCEFHLSIGKARNNMEIKEFHDLKTLLLESTHLCSLIDTFPSGRTIKNLTVDSSKSAGLAEVAKFNLERLFAVFPNAGSITLGPWAWFEAETCFCTGGVYSSTTKGLKEIIAHIFVNDVEITLAFIFYILERCTNLREVTLLIHREVESSIASNLISRCMSRCARVGWRWGLWKEGTKDAMGFGCPYTMKQDTCWT